MCPEDNVSGDNVSGEWRQYVRRQCVRYEDSETTNLTSTLISLSLTELSSLLPKDDRLARMLARSCCIGNPSIASSISMSRWLYGIAMI